MLRRAGAEAIAGQLVAPARSSKSSCGTMMWRKPVIEQTEQLQSSAGTGGSGISARNRTAPQWHPPETLIMGGSYCGAALATTQALAGSNLDRLRAKRRRSAGRARRRTGWRSVSLRQPRTSFLPARSASDAVAAHLDRRPGVRRWSRARWPALLARSRSAVWTMLVTVDGRLGQRGSGGEGQAAWRGRILVMSYPLVQGREIRRDLSLVPNSQLMLATMLRIPFCNNCRMQASTDQAHDGSDARLERPSLFRRRRRAGQHAQGRAARCGSARPRSPAASPRWRKRSACRCSSERQAGYALTADGEALLAPCPPGRPRPPSSSPRPPASRARDLSGRSG